MAGVFTFALFAAGIIGTGMLAVPVLAGSAAYAVSEVFGWTEGLDRRPREASFLHHDRGRNARRRRAELRGLDRSGALLSAVVNSVLRSRDGVIVVIAMNRRIMGRLTLPRPMLVGRWVATFVMALVTVGFFAI